MDENDFENELEDIRLKSSREEFVQILLDKIDQNPEKKYLSILEVWLQVNSYRDRRVVDYWKEMLSNGNSEQVEHAINNLLIKGLTGDDYAHDVLRNFLGEEPSLEVVKRRLYHRLGIK